MKSLGRYALTAAAIVLSTMGVLWAFLDGAGRASLLVAAAIALPVQITTFALLLRSGVESSRFMMWWGVGVLGRMVVVVGVGLALDSLTTLDPTVLLLSICGFFFALLLLEPAFVSRATRSAQFAQ